jgi:hypothetical protein
MEQGGGLHHVVQARSAPCAICARLLAGRNSTSVDKRDAMQKGLGLYSTHQTTIFFLKATLLSFWIGVDLIALMLLSTFSIAVLAQHAAVVMVAVSIFISGTVFSGLFVWATGSLFGRTGPQTASGVVAKGLQRLKQQPGHLIGAGVVAIAILILAANSYFSYLQHENELISQIGRADMGIARKCAEVADLEKHLFQSDEKFVMTQCLIQYDRTYAILR